MAEYRGSGGAVFDIAVPEPGTHARELFDAKIKSGELVLVEPEAPAPKPRSRSAAKEE